MIKANELRIGNLIQDKNGGTVEVDSVSESGLNFYSWSNTHYGMQSGGAEYSYDLESVFPIPLTEEWLERLGFNKASERVYFKNGIGYEFGFTCRAVYKVDSCFVLFKHIIYVHQLQNLYFAITGGELELKNE